MDIRNRMADVVKLRENVCQEFINFFLNDNWQQELFELARDEVKNNTPQKVRYKGTYDKMIDLGIETYTVDKMDFTIISAIVDANNRNKFSSMKKISNKTREALNLLRDTRNPTGHTTGNEDKEELYLHGLLTLCYLKKFVTVVFDYEQTIKEEKRMAYRQKYVNEIENLKDLLDEERIELIQWKKEINKDILKIKKSNNQAYEWGRVFYHYFDSYMKYERTDQSYEKYNYFIIQASNYGIEGAHSLVANHFIVEKDYAEAEHRLFMWYESKKEFLKNDAQNIISSINGLIKQKYELTSTLQEIIN